MPSNWTKICWVTAFSIVGSVAMTSALCVATGMDAWAFSISVAVLCPLLLAPPVTYVCFKQSDRVNQLHEQLKIAHEQLSERVRRDELTGLLNRTAFVSESEKAIRSGQQNALLLLDADHFKAINDGYGHISGDLALIAIAAVVKEQTLTRGWAGRVGGEEFAVFLPDATIEHATDIAEGIRNGIAVTEIRNADGARIPLTVSVGATVGQPDVPFVELYAEADRRLYEAKRSGRNRVVSNAEAPLAAA